MNFIKYKNKPENESKNFEDLSTYGKFAAIYSAHYKRISQEEAPIWKQLIDKCDPIPLMKTLESLIATEFFNRKNPPTPKDLYWHYRRGSQQDTEKKARFWGCSQEFISATMKAEEKARQENEELKCAMQLFAEKAPLKCLNKALHKIAHTKTYNEYTRENARQCLENIEETNQEDTRKNIFDLPTFIQFCVIGECIPQYANYKIAGEENTEE